MERFEILGVNDDENFCECCGKQGLARVVWVRDSETGQTRHFGTTCALKPAKGFESDREIKKAVSKWKQLEDQSFRIAWRSYREEGGEFIKISDTSLRPQTASASSSYKKPLKKD